MSSLSRLQRAAQVGIVVVAVILVVAALRDAQEFFAPALLALVVGIVLSPISDLWEKIGFSPVWGALTSLLLTLVVLGALLALLQPVVISVVEAWPMIMSESRDIVRSLQGTLNSLQNVTAEVDRAITGAADGPPGDETGGVPLPTTTDALWLAPAVAGQAVIFVGVLFFFLLTRHEVYRWLARALTPEGEPNEIALRLRRAERMVSRYFLTITIINCALGLAVFGAMTLLGLPSAYIWGVAATLLNFVLYLGPATMVAALGVTGLVLFDGTQSLFPAAAYVGLNFIEAQFVTPTAIGKNLSVNPLLVFLSLVFFLWLWGPVGGFVAIPLLLWCIAVGTAVRGDRRGEIVPPKPRAVAE